MAEPVFEDILRGITHALPEAPRPASFLRDYLFRAPEFFASDLIDIAQWRDDRGVATSTPRGAPANVTEKTEYTGLVVKPPSFKPKKILTSLDLTKRLPGEGMTVNGNSRANAVTALSAMILDQLDQSISRAEILQAFQALLTGAVTVYSETGDALATISTGRISALNTANVGTVWTTSTADALGDINTLADLTQKWSGFPGDYVIMGQTAANAALKLESVQRQLSTDWSARGQLDNTLEASGARKMGRADGRDWWQVPDWYKHPKTGVLTAFMDTDRIIVGSTMAGITPLYALVDDVENPVAAERHMKAWPDKEAGAYIYQMLTAALMFPLNPNAHGVRRVTGF